MKHASELNGGLPPVEYREEVKGGRIDIFAIAGPSTVGRLKARCESGEVWQLEEIVVSNAAPYLSRSWVARLFKEWGRLFDPVSFRGVGIGSELMARFQARCLRSEVTEVFGSIVHHDLEATPDLIDWYRNRGFEVHEPDRRCLRGAIYQVIWRFRAQTVESALGRSRLRR